MEAASLCWMRVLSDSEMFEMIEQKLAIAPKLLRCVLQIATVATPFGTYSQFICGLFDGTSDSSHSAGV
jgi:hypothetical protein